MQFFNQGNYWAALDYLKQNSKRINHVLFDWYLGNVYFKLHRYSNALEHILNFISVTKKDPLNLNFLGEIYLEMNQYKNAEKTFNEVLSIAPEVSPIFLFTALFICIQLYAFLR